jgi:hypothetical protein
MTLRHPRGPPAAMFESIPPLFEIHATRTLVKPLTSENTRRMFEFTRTVFDFLEWLARSGLLFRAPPPDASRVATQRDFAAFEWDYGE